MIKIWFLMALLAYPTHPTIMYKGFYTYKTQVECEEHRIAIENALTEMEFNAGRTVWVEAVCLPVHAFEEQFKKFKGV